MDDVAREGLAGMWKSLTQLSLEMNALTICPVSVSVLFSPMS